VWCVSCTERNQSYRKRCEIRGRKEPKKEKCPNIKEVVSLDRDGKRMQGGNRREQKKKVWGSKGPQSNPSGGGLTEKVGLKSEGGNEK